jgi:hypothetical protein
MGVDGVRPELPAALGAEAVGRVIAVGEGVDASGVGERVLPVPTLEHAMVEEVLAQGVRHSRPRRLHRHDMAAAVDAPKIAPEIVAEATLDAVEADQHEALADEPARQIRAALSGPLSALYPALAPTHVHAVATDALVDGLGPIRNISTSGEIMSTQRQDRRPSPIRRRAALATGVITALAIAAPVAEASAATPHAVPPSAIASLPAANPPPSFVEHSVARAAVATGPTLTGDVFNGGTAIVTSPSPAVGTVVGSP